MPVVKRINKMRYGGHVFTADQTAYHAARDAWKKQQAEGGNGGTSGGGDEDEIRFAGLYHGGTFDKKLNKLAVDIETLWQGYYPSLYNPHTQEAAAHLPANGVIPPLDGDQGVNGDETQPAKPVKVKYGRGKAKRRGEEHVSGLFDPPMPGEDISYKNTGGNNDEDEDDIPAGATGAFRPTVNPDGSLIPWADPRWMISMGQWRGR